MKLKEFRHETDTHRNRISAKVVWEESGLLEKEVFIETDNRVALDVRYAPHAFLVGCLIPALHLGEKRIAMEGGICPELREGLGMVMALMHHWSHGAYIPLTLETGTNRQPLKQVKTARSGMLFSGGIDSLAALRLNRLGYSPEHPGYVRDCLMIHGFDIGGVQARGMKYPVFDRAMEAIGTIARNADVTEIPVYTNIRHLYDDRELWLNSFFGAVLAAVAHAFSSRLDLFFIASSYDLPNLVPCGSHPLLDPEYSSSEMRIRHRDVALTRIEKLRIVSEWDAGFQNFRVCLANVPDRLNCGRCEKCVRTMTGLVALGVLDKTRAFVEDDVTPDMFEPFRIDIRHREPFYTELIPLLEKRGRTDLVKVIRQKLSSPPPGTAG